MFTQFKGQNYSLRGRYVNNTHKCEQKKLSNFLRAVSKQQNFHCNEVNDQIKKIDNEEDESSYYVMRL